jgi:hypothetical protein
MRPVFDFFCGRHTFFAFWLLVSSFVLCWFHRISGADFAIVMGIVQTIEAAKSAHEAVLKAKACENGTTACEAQK